jgi:hypothetical protein
MFSGISPAISVGMPVTVAPVCPFGFILSELPALVMASGLMAEQRLSAAGDGNLNPINISFVKTLESMKSLCMRFSPLRVVC